MEESKTTNIDQRSRLLAGEIWHAMQAAPKYVDGQAIGNCEALKAAAEIIRNALQYAFEDGLQAELKRTAPTVHTFVHPDDEPRDCRGAGE